MASFLTKTARKKLARQAAAEAYGKKPNNYQVGKAGKIIDKLVNDNPKKFINFDDVRYCTPKHEAIITATIKVIIAESEALLGNQQKLF